MPNVNDNEIVGVLNYTLNMYSSFITVIKHEIEKYNGYDYKVNEYSRMGKKRLIKSLEEERLNNIKKLYFINEYFALLTKYGNGIGLSGEQKALIEKFMPFFDGINVFENDEKNESMLSYLKNKGNIKDYFIKRKFDFDEYADNHFRGKMLLFVMPPILDTLDSFANTFGEPVEEVESDRGDDEEMNNLDNMNRNQNNTSITQEEKKNSQIKQTQNTGKKKMPRSKKYLIAFAVTFVISLIMLSSGGASGDSSEASIGVIAFFASIILLILFIRRMRFEGLRTKMIDCIMISNSIEIRELNNKFKIRETKFNKILMSIITDAELEIKSKEGIVYYGKRWINKI